MQSDGRKQFLMLAGKPLFLHALEFFLSLEDVGEVCLVLNREALDDEPARLAAEVAAKYPGVNFRTAVGGARRQDSVFAGMKALASNPVIVLVHDCARPFPPPGPVRESIRVAEEFGGAILATPVTDTVKMVEAGSLAIRQTLDRDLLWRAQTPQTFRYAELLAAMEDVAQSGITITDEAMAFERMGREVRIVPSTADNLKVTVPEDLPRAEAILRQRRGQ